MAQHIINRFDFNTICGGVLRLIERPDLYQKYKPFLDHEYFFYNDISAHVKALKKLLQILKSMDGEHKTGEMTVESVDSYLAYGLREGQVDIDTKALFARMRSEDGIKNKANDPACFKIFLDYLKVLQIAKHSGKMFQEYQAGKVDEAAKHMANALAEINSIQDPNVYTFDPIENYDDVMIGKDIGYIQDSLPLGCIHLDAALGGFETQTLNVFTSPPNGGKSAMCHHLIAQCFRHRKRIHVTCVEDRPRSFLCKLTAAWTGIEVRRLRNEYRNLTADEKLKVEQVQQLMKAYLKVDFVYGQSVEMIQKTKLDFDLECKVKGIPAPVVDIIDYTGHIAGRTLGDKMYEKLRTAYGSRKDFALANNKICFDFAQINREGSKRGPRGDELLTMSDLAGSFDIAQVCDNIISINRNMLDRSDHKATLHVCKARDGEAGGSFQVGTKFHLAQYDMADCTWVNPPSDYVRNLQAELGNGKG